MSGATVWITIIVLVLAGGGVWVFNNASDRANEAFSSPSPSAEAIDEPGSGQFKQQVPEAVQKQVEEELLDGGDEQGEEEDVISGEVEVISMTDTGFQPSEITVEQGTTVRFVNNGQAKHWPASAVHPTHEVLPDFDSRRGLLTGETYEYTFKQAGAWSFHDHLRADLTGTITVE